MKRDLRLRLAAYAEKSEAEGYTQALAAIRARTAMEVMKERRELKANLYDVMEAGGEWDESSSLLRLPWQRTTH